MKKLIVMLSAIAFAMGAQAAAVSWKVTNADYVNKTVYAITGLSASEVVAYFSSTTESDWSNGIEGATSATIKARGGSGNSSNVGSTMVFAIIDGSVAEGTKWLVTGDVSTTGFTYEGTATPPGTLTVDASAFSSTGTFTSSGSSGGVPEPTSALLLLMGGAMLALRRKQK